MNISVITVPGSSYAKYLLNHAKRIDLPIQTVVVVHYGLVRSLKIVHSMFVRRLGWWDTFFFLANRVLQERQQGVVQEWRGSPVIHDYESLAHNVMHTSDLNDPLFLQQFSASKPDLMILAQTGLVKKPLLQIPGIGTLNAHTAWLPEYRGNHVLYWTLYFQQFHRIGYTIHYVDEGMDTGDIIRFTASPPRPGESYDVLQARLMEEAAIGLAETAKECLVQPPKGEPQRAEAGRKYFAMPHALRKNALNNLHRYYRSLEQ
ncbi:MAG: hypothetical protein HQL77_12330 [Magnetococcales bacterium]|nr:hypothetical protein [Magnetococcales bacterium]